MIFWLEFTDSDGLSEAFGYIRSKSSSYFFVNYTRLDNTSGCTRGLVVTLTVSLGGIVSLVTDQVLRSVVVLATEVALQDGLGTVGVSLLSID